MKSSKPDPIQEQESTLDRPGASKAGKSLFERWDITLADLTRLVDTNPSLRGMLLGYVAEHKFEELVEAYPGITEHRKHDDHNRKRKSDRVMTYKGEEFSVEVKSLQTNSIKNVDGVWTGKAQVDGSDRRIVEFPDGSQLNTTLLLRGDFDILAINCFAFDERWRFAFIRNEDLPPSTYRKYSAQQQASLIASLVRVTWPPQAPFVSDPFLLVEELYQERLLQRENSSGETS